MIVISLISADNSPHMAYTDSNEYQLVSGDAGIIGFEQGAFWSVFNDQSKFCSLGDIATRTKLKPAFKAVLVSSRKLELW